MVLVVLLLFSHVWLKVMPSHEDSMCIQLFQFVSQILAQYFQLAQYFHGSLLRNAS